MGIITKAVRINSANQITDGVITGAKLANDTITADKIGVLDYVRSLQYDVYNDAKSDVKARIEHDEATNYSRFLVGANVASLDSVFNILSSLGSSVFGFGTKVSLVNMNNKRLISLSAPSSNGDALSLGNESITNSEISPTANISRTKLGVGNPQRAFGSINILATGYHDITGVITPSSYPALALGFAKVSTTNFIGTSKLLLRDQNNNVLNDNIYANITDSGTPRGVGDGYTNMVSSLISSGSVKLSHFHNTTITNIYITGTLMVVEL